VDSARPRLRIGQRFCGPPGAANGGFASGSLAALLGSDGEVVAAARALWITIAGTAGGSR